jgi:hypothetical protein
MANNVIVGYSANDFFYTQAGSTMPSNDKCSSEFNLNNGQDWQTKCNDANFMDNSYNCINMQLCLNKEKATYLLENENSHIDAEKRNGDMKVVYDRTIMDTVNLGIGIIFVLFIIFRNRNIS